MGAAEHVVHAGRLIALLLAGLLACRPDTDAGTDEDVFAVFRNPTAHAGGAR